jgi:hypothetical protein
VLACGVLLAAGLACRSPGTDVDATVSAVGTAVERTLVAMTQPAANTPQVPPASPTAAALPTAIASPTDFRPPPPTPVNTPVPDTATPEVVIRPNGPIVYADRRDTPPTIDAQADDWPGTLPHAIDQVVFGQDNWGGPADNSATFAVGWDASYLYLLVDVVDDVHVQLASGLVLYRGDSLELQLDADLPGDYEVTSLNADDFQMGLSPGPDGQTPEAYLWNPATRSGVPDGLQLATRLKPEGAGYILEIAIPWTLFGVVPAAGQTFGFALNSSDNDTPATTVQETMVSSVSTRTLLNPTTWGTLMLNP